MTKSAALCLLLAAFVAADIIVEHPTPENFWGDVRPSYPRMDQAFGTAIDCFDTLCLVSENPYTSSTTANMVATVSVIDINDAGEWNVVQTVFEPTAGSVNMYTGFGMNVKWLDSDTRFAVVSGTTGEVHVFSKEGNPSGEFLLTQSLHFGMAADVVQIEAAANRFLIHNYTATIVFTDHGNGYGKTGELNPDRFGQRCHFVGTTGLVCFYIADNPSTVSHWTFDADDVPHHVSWEPLPPPPADQYGVVQTYLGDMTFYDAGHQCVVISSSYGMTTTGGVYVYCHRSNGWELERAVFGAMDEQLTLLGLEDGRIVLHSAVYPMSTWLPTTNAIKITNLYLPTEDEAEDTVFAIPDNSGPIDLKAWRTAVTRQTIIFGNPVESGDSDLNNNSPVPSELYHVGALHFVENWRWSHHVPYYCSEQREAPGVRMFGEGCFADAYCKPEIHGDCSRPAEHFADNMLWYCRLPENTVGMSPAMFGECPM